jgi:hypothetical protein
MRQYELESIALYKQQREQNIFNVDSVKSFVDGYISSLRAFLSNEEAQGILDPFEKAKDEFKIKMLENGWPVEDMPLIEKLWVTVQNQSAEPFKSEGEALIESMMDYNLDTFEKHQRKLAMIENYTKTLNPNLADSFSGPIGEAYMRKPAIGEYAGDQYLIQELGKENFDPYYVQKVSSATEAEKTNKKNLRFLGSEHNRTRSERQKNILRRKGTYVLPKLDNRELESHKLNDSQKKFKTAMSQRDAMKKIFGNDKYDEIDAMYKGSEETRRIPLHNARGNAQLDAGGRVIEFDFAGSGFAQPRKEHHGLSGKEVANGSDSIESSLDLTGQYGAKVRKIGDMKIDEDSFIRRKETSRDGKTKIRYHLPGPSCTYKGMTDTGKTRISNNVAIALKGAQEFLKPLMEEYKKNKDNPGYKMKPVHLNFYGHSRGAVAASESVFEVYEWLKAQKGFEGFLENVHFDLVQRDPVPGPDVIASRRRRPDLRKIPNLTSTTIVTTLADLDVGGWLFRPQRVRGQERLIIGTTPHGVGLEGVDKSQLNQKDDGMAHQHGYYDAETKEFYRGSGVNDLPKGVYLTDEKHNLIRVTRYSQVDQMINMVIPEDTFLGGQEARQMSIREEVKNWFLDNGELLKYKDEGERDKDRVEAQNNMDYILKSKSSEVKGIQEAIRRNMAAEADENLDMEGKMKARQELIGELRKLIDVNRIEKVKKDKERDPKKRTDNKRWNALCDLYILMKTEDNYQIEKYKSYADYKTATEDVADTIRYFGDIKCAANQLAVVIEGLDPGKNRDAMDLYYLANAVGSCGVNSTLAQVDVLNKNLLTFIQKHRGEDRQKWSTDKKIDEKVQEFAERFMESLGDYDCREESILHDKTLKDKTFGAILDSKYEKMNADISKEKRMSAKSATRCVNVLAETTAKAQQLYNKLMRLNVNVEKDSAQFTAMREALQKVTELNEKSSPVEIHQAIDNLCVASKTYTYKIENRGGGKVYLFGKRGAERLDLAYDITAFARENVKKEMSTAIQATKAIDSQLGKQREPINLNVLENEENHNEVHRANTVKKTEKTNQVKRSNTFSLE